MKKKSLSYRFRIILVTLLAISLESQAMSQPPPPPGNDRRPPRFELGDTFPPPLLEELNLTPAQTEELDAIKRDLKARLEKLLTDEQKRTVENFRPRPPGGPGRPDGKGPPPPPPRGGGNGPDRPQRPERPSDEASNAATPKSALAVKLKDLPTGVTRVPVTFSNGHDTDPRDGGRPVVLIAAALGVTSDVFRGAFSRVRPARGGAEPEPAQVRQNKAVLMEALGKHGITNDRLDTVSNYYRYPPGRNSLWTNQPAVANALVKDGVVIDFEIVSGGSGYSSSPTVSVPKIKIPESKVELSFGQQMESNGSVTAIKLVKTQAE